jgi:hypothetical protein
MTEVRAFVGHSFIPGDKDIFDPTDEVVVSKFLTLFTEIARLVPTFSWQHAERAQPIGIDSKVLSMFDEKNLFIGICTKKERVIPDTYVHPKWSLGKAKELNAVWKTSDWIIQEIGLAIGRGCRVILLVEDGVRAPGGLQGALEYIEFERSAPEAAVNKLLQMICNLIPDKKSNPPPLIQATQGVDSKSQEPLSTFDWKSPNSSWDDLDYRMCYRMATMQDDESAMETIYREYLATHDATTNIDAIVRWRAFCEYTKIANNSKGSIQKLKDLTKDYPHSADAFKFLGAALSFFGQFRGAADNYEIAAEKATNSAQKFHFLGRRVVQLIREGVAAGVVSKARDELLEFARSANVEEVDLLSTLMEIAEESEDNIQQIALMERIIALDPSQVKTRFSLAFKHSEIGNDGLALFHYLKIPAAARDPIAWNNLGVALDKFELKCRSVDAYRKSEAAGETLAISNLALDRRHSLATKGAGALLPDRRVPRAPRLSRRGSRITALNAAASVGNMLFVELVLADPWT